MTTTNGGAVDGGPAFPIVGMKDGCSFRDVDGITLRDYFAARAMQGLLAHPTNGNEDAATITNWAYEQADDMLAARNPSHD